MDAIPGRLNVILQTIYQARGVGEAYIEGQVKRIWIDGRVCLGRGNERCQTLNPQKAKRQSNNRTYRLKPQTGLIPMEFSTKQFPRCLHRWSADRVSVSHFVYPRSTFSPLSAPFASTPFHCVVATRPGYVLCQKYLPGWFKHNGRGNPVIFLSSWKTFNPAISMSTIESSGWILHWNLQAFLPP